MELLEILKDRYEKNMVRHPETSWDDVEKKLFESKGLLKAISFMEETEGSPDLVYIKSLDKLIYVDMSKETPNRKNLCYDEAARLGRKKFPPESSVEAFCKEYDLKLVDEEMYKQLQELGEMDLKTSSWLYTEPELRKLGGAIFGDRRYKRTFIYHNGADSYYSSRGFRAYVEI